MSETKEKDKPKTNHIEEYFDAQQGNKSSELFKLSETEEIDLKTDLSDNEIKIITTLVMNDIFLKECGIKPIFEKYYNKYLRLRVSKDRLGRTEFVKMNTQDNTDEVLQKLGNVSTITNARK